MQYQLGNKTNSILRLWSIKFSKLIYFPATFRQCFKLFLKQNTPTSTPNLPSHLFNTKCKKQKITKLSSASCCGKKKKAANYWRWNAAKRKDTCGDIPAATFFVHSRQISCQPIIKRTPPLQPTVAADGCYKLRSAQAWRHDQTKPKEKFEPVQKFQQKTIITEHFKLSNGTPTSKHLNWFELIP